MKFFPVMNWYRMARISLWRRHGYRSLMDVPKDFILRSSTDLFSRRGTPPFSLPLGLRLRCLNDPVYVRVANSDFLVLGEIFDRDEYVHVKQWQLPPQPKIFDLGANIGLASVYFTSIFPDAHLVAVEPDDDNCRLIGMNCRRLLEEGKLHVVRGFVAATDGVAGLDRTVRAWAFHKVDTVDSDHEAVPCYSMPHLMRDSGYDQIDLLKCDIEGSEVELFRNCAPWIGAVRHLIVETHTPYLVKDLYKDLCAAGWDFDVTYEEQEEQVGISFMKRKDMAAPEV